MWASYKGHVILVQEFLERGADPNVKAEVQFPTIFTINCNRQSVKTLILS